MIFANVRSSGLGTAGVLQTSASTRRSSRVSLVPEMASGSGSQSSSSRLADRALIESPASVHSKDTMNRRSASPAQQPTGPALEAWTVEAGSRLSPSKLIGACGRLRRVRFGGLMIARLVLARNCMQPTTLRKANSPLQKRMSK